MRPEDLIEVARWLANEKSPSREFTGPEADSWVEFAVEAIGEIAKLPAAGKRMLVVRLMFRNRSVR